MFPTHPQYKERAPFLPERSQGAEYPRPGASDRRRAYPDWMLPIFSSYDERALPFVTRRSRCTKLHRRVLPMVISLPAIPINRYLDLQVKSRVS